MLILPGSKATVADLAWLRERGLDRALVACPTTVLGLCAGYQMLGHTIDDPGGVESTSRSTPGLGLLQAATRFGPDKVTRLRQGRVLGLPVRGYQIHHGVVDALGPALVEFTDPAGGVDGTCGRTPVGGTVWGTTLHGILDDDGFRARLLSETGKRAGKRVTLGGRFEAARQARIDRVADAVHTHLDMVALDNLVTAGPSR